MKSFVTSYKITTQAAPCTATRVRYLVAGDDGVDSAAPENSIGMTRVDRLVHEEVL